MRLPFFWFLSLFLIASASAQNSTTVTFPSQDGLPITADSYITGGGTRPLIVLFHQAGWSRGAYRSIAPRLNAMGFDALAGDLRSGGTVNGVANQTARRARRAGKETSYLDALPDMIAALKYAHALTGGKARIIAWGSSYSAGLVLKIVGDHPELADAVLAFSPGEYYTRLGKPADWIRQSARLLRVPVFITSARDEKRRWQAIFDAIPSRRKVAFVPQTEGHHGSRALWETFSDSRAYWDAVTDFLKDLR